VDFTEAWSKTTDATKSGWKASAGLVSNTLDVVTPAFAPFASWWDRKADARLSLRTEENLKALIKAQREYVSARSTAATAKAQRRAARANSKNPISGDRRAARKADKAASGHKSTAKTDLKAAAANYPQKLTTVAAKWHAVHLASTSGLSYWWSSAEHWTVWPAGSSLALIAGIPAALWLGRRQVTLTLDDGLSAEERALMTRLDPVYWAQHRDERGLSETVTGVPTVKAGGIECAIRLDGTWTLGKLRAAEENVRALLGARTDLPMTIAHGDKGGWGRMVFRTRDALAGVDMTWSPGAAFGVYDDETAADVRIPLGQRMLIAGRSGSGKSWSVRPSLFEASEGECNALVVIDLKKVEAKLWQHRARVATTLEEVIDLVAELVEEMNERLDLVPRGEDTLTPTPERPRITVFVDEGGEVVSSAKEALAGLESIARMGRAPIIDLWWATQKPTMSGPSAGIPPQIASQLSTVVSLAVRTPTEARTVLGEDAQAKGWNAEELPAPGYALVRTDNPADKPRRIKTRAISPKGVIALPAQPIWRRESVAAEVPAPAPAPAIEGARPALRLVKDGGDFLLAPPAPAAEVPDVLDGLTDNQRAVYETVRGGAASNAEIAKALGMNPGSVARAIDALVKRNVLVKDGTQIRIVGAA
jgi:DNA segregation ATPase FtsK/SpoIIIE, S-DNA-T family